ncbi:serine hydrolase domain-containing protein [Streptomyces sp. NPDC048290]|uniref:serine hydrolase domain-containing protein n=1 Tax=Streptomyces sp. NPDC048290 TaxID=3155811 RepID=UPI003428630E
MTKGTSTSLRHERGPGPGPKARYRPRSVRPGLLLTAGALLATTLAVVPPATGAEAAADSPREANRMTMEQREPRPRTPGTHQATQAALDAIVAAGTPGALARATNGRAHWSGTAGVADLRTGQPRRATDRFRVGSLTKTFTATLLLQLEAEGRLSLDDSVEKWLPGVIRGRGHDGRKVSLRQLLNHTSGIFSYNRDPGFLARFTGEPFLEHRYDGATPQELVRIGLSHPPEFPPGTGWSYSDTNYILAGLVVERATGHDYATEVERRLIRPLRLHSTTVPGTSPTVPRPHARHYSRLYLDHPDAPIHDVTDFNPSVAWAAGQIISTADDLNRFFRALLGGELLPARQQRALLDTVPTGDGEAPPTGHSSSGYGLGIRSDTLSCGVTVWGHGGQVPGSLSRTAATRDGRHVLTLNRNGDWGEQTGEDAVLEAEFCGARPAAGSDDGDTPGAERGRIPRSGVEDPALVVP